MNAKKLHSLFSLCVIILSTSIVYGQQIPNSNFNASFESALHSGTQPPGWKASNVSQMGVDGIFITPSGNGNDGSQCVRLENLWVGALGIGANAPAYMALGQPWSYISGTNLSSASGGTDGGLAFTYRPDSLEVWVKRTYSSTETAHALVYLWTGTFHGQTYKNKGGGCGGEAHTNEESDIRGTNTCTSNPGSASLIGQGEWTSSSQISSWTLVKAPITYQNNLVPQYINVILSSADYPNGRDASKVQAGSVLYVDNFKLIYSSKIHELYISNKKWGTFNPDTKEYTYALGVGATEIPTIEARRSGRVLSGSEITINYGTVGGTPTTITVKAEDGSSTTTYTINFVAQQSTNAMPTGISVGGTPIANFSGYVTSYNVELPYGTTTIPEITVVKAEEGQTYTITPSATLPGTATVKVFAEDVSISKTYTINFTVAALTDNTLKDILINGKSLTGFSPTKTTYTVEMPLGTTVDPTITPVSAYAAGEQVIVLTNNGLSGKSTITVTPKGGSNTRTYNISYKITASTYSYLSNISVGGTPLTDFVPETLNYSYTLPIGTTALPTIIATPGDDYQTITKEEGGIDGVTKITVTAASGAISIYRITFSTLKSDVATLGDLTIGGVTIAGFDSNAFDYTYALPIGTTTLPTIAWTAGDAYQTISKTEGGINGTTRIVVRAQNGTTNTYSITFSVAQATISTLLDLRVGGVTITDFAPETLSYTYVLPRGTVALPEITYTPYDAYQTIRKVEGGVNGETKITVKSQSGNQSIYTITFSVEKSADATLSSIKVGGIDIPNFRSDSLHYTYELPSGTVILPTIEGVKNDSYQTIYTTKGGVDGTSYLRVVAENGAEQTYSITFSVLKSENAFLKDILIDGTSLVEFNPTTFAYTYILSESATACPTITVVKEDGQTVTITSPKLTGTARIEVKPEEGASNIYTIKFTYLQSNNKQLTDLQVNGVTITDFASSTLNYTYELANGTTSLPAITYTKGDALQTVLVNAGDVNGTTTITVKAENGDTNIYSIAFTVAKSSDATLQSLKVGGTEIVGFNPLLFSYNYTLATGTKVCPEITAIGNHLAQNIRINAPFVNGVATITVTAENGDKQIYTINLAFEPLTNTTLNGITINGTPLATFDPSVLSYNVDLPSDATAPLIDFVSADTTQVIALSNNGLNGTQILVVAENGDQQMYTITYTVAKNSNALLADLQLYNGSQFVSLTDFNATTFSYVDSLAWRTTTIPVINPVAAHKGQIITIAYSGINKTTRIHVVAEDGVTTQDYEVAFPVKKSSVCTLSDISVDNGQFTPSFDPDITLYKVTLPYGTTKVPSITWLLGEEDGKTVTEQRIELVAPNVLDTTLLKVTAEDGSIKTYQLAFEVANSSNPNVLNGILVDGIGYFDLTSTTETSFDVTLPYGTTTMPNIVCTKSYAEQTVVMDKGTVHSTTIITVKANKDNLPDKVYTLNTQVAELPTAVLSDIKVNGTSIAGFNPAKTNYVVAVTDVPTVEFVAASGADASNRTIENTKQIQVEVAATDVNDTYTTTYNVFFYYSNDVIPNSEFDSWGTAKYNNGAKPTGWQVPADGAEKKSVTATYTTGPEVNKATSGTENSVRLRTWSSHYSIYGSIPGLMTLGNLNLTLAASNGSTMSISGGIPFRNTPEVVLMNYKPVSKTGNVNNMKFTYTLSDGTTTVNKTFTDASFNNTSKTMNLNVKSAILAPTTMNIIVNSAHSENPGDISYTSAGVNFWADMKQESDMYVDKLRFQYSSKVNSILINGSAVSGFDGSVPSNTVTVGSDFQGLPQITPVGEVADQEYTITVDNVENSAGTTKKSRYVELKSTAEDGTSTTYNLYIQRLLSTNKALAGLSVNGTALADFDAATYTYNVTVANGTTKTPDITALRSSQHQTISFVTDGVKPATITVTAEDGTSQNYTINFVEEKAADVTLQSIVIDTNPADFTFDASEHTYLVTLPYGSTLPAVHFEKVSDGQTVIVTNAETTTLKVVAENNVDEATYTIHFVQSAAPATSGQLMAIAANGVGLTAFDKETYSYTQTKDNTEPIQTTFVRESATDSVTQIITNDSITWHVTGTLESHTYKLKLNKILSANVDLGTILVDGDSLADFNAAVYEYVVNTNEAVSIEAKLSEFGQTLTTTFSFGSVYSPAPVGRMSAPVSDDYLGYFTFTVTSADGLKNQTTTVALKKIKSTNADLATIMLDGEIISTASVNYTVDNDFDANTIEYNISIPSVNPKTAEPAVPNITIKAADNGQVVVIEKNPINQASYITVTAENGNEKVYTLNITSEKSSNADLTGIAVNYVAITDFRKDSNHYVADLDKAVIPIISYTVEDYFQQGVKITTNKDSAILVVTAENGNKQTYVVTFNVKALSNNANLSNIVIGNTSISGFAADTYVYNVDLAVGTENLPVIEAVKGHDGQTIEIADNGVNGATVITVTAEDMVTQQTYTVNFSVIKSTNAYLENIAVNYQSVADFVKTTFNYAVVLDNAIAPTVAYTCGDVYQTVSVQTNIDSAVLIVTAQDGITVNKYVINFTVAASSNANLADILLDGVSLSGFRQDSLFYHVQLPVGTTLLPDIAVAGGADGQTINITNNGLRDTTYIVVTAEDGVTVQTYSLSFDVEKSDVDTLKMIYLNGVEVLNYDAQASQFDITLPVGTRRIPFITYDKGYPMQTVVLDTILMDIANYAAKIAIEVTSEKGNQRTYLLNFTIDKSTIDTLKMIYINYEAVSNYKGNTLRYDFNLPVGTRVWPTVTYDKGDTLQTVKMDTVAIEKYAAQFNLTVTAESGSANIYELHFGVDKSVVDTLKMLRINSAAIALAGESYTSDAAFAGQTFAYHVEWAIGTRSLPRIDWIAGDSLQQVSINKEIETLNDTIVVTVKAENGNEKTYTIYNKLLHSEVDTLKMIYTNSEALENFEPRIFNYDITLPVGTRQWPTIDFDKGDHWQTVSVNTIATSTYVAVTKLEVTAEDSIHKNVYTLNFTVEKSVVDTLKGIYLEGMPLEGFDASIYTYNYLLPYGTVTLPNITWEAGDIYQVVDTVSNGVNGDFVFTVTAENGSVTTYTIHFGVEKSHNANLEKILVDGTPLVGFDADISEYLVKLPYGTVTVPVITYEKAEANQQVELTAAATLADTTVIKVVAEDNMTIKTYKLHFEVLLSDNALLENIFIGGVALTQKAETFKADEDFAPENFSYNIGLPFGTTVLPEITWVAQVADYDTIYLTKQATLNGTSTITVVSQDKMNTNEYELTFSMLKSNNNSLQDLLVDGVTIEGFHPDTLVYSIEYPVGTDSTQLLTTANISYVEGDSAQTVVVSQTDPMVILITVTAGNGDVNVYVIEMTIKLSDNSLLKKIFLDGVGLKQFSPTTFEYEYLLFAGNSIPEITVEKGDEKQEVYITMNPIGEFTYIFVEAEDKSVSEYKILFKNSTESTTTEPSEEDVCWTPIGNGTFKASTRKDKVKVAIFHTNGRLIDIQDVPLVDPNDVICDPGAAGVHFHFEKKGDIYICVFYYEGKKIIKSEKFLY